VRDGTLMAQPFSASKLTTTGDAVPVAEQVDADSGLLRPLLLGHFSASQNGVLMYTAGDEPAGGGIQLTWFDRTGKKLDTAGAPGNLEWFSISPDGASVALTRQDPQTGKFDIWTRDAVHQTETRLTFMGNNRFPVWSADGTHIFFWSDRDVTYKMYQKAANGTGQVESVDASGGFPVDASRDGRYLLTQTTLNNPKTGNDVWVHPLTADRKSFPYVATEFHERWPRLSPDGHWLAYQSNESQQFQIYVVSFPQPGGKWQISATGGIDPVWSRDGRELYYYSADNKIMAVDVTSEPAHNGPAPVRGTGPQFQFGEPKALFPVQIPRGNNSFDVSKDGRLLLPVVVQQEQPMTVLMTVVLNWQAELKK
jgi:eukaryotic-like serine/threonine-protein kinase